MEPTQDVNLRQALAEQSRGNAAFERLEPEAVATIYKQCLHLLNQAVDHQIVSLLQNLAIAHMQLQNHAEAFMCAMAVLALFPSDSHPKACFHAAKAAAAMGLADAAAWLLQHVPVSSTGPAVAELAATLHATVGSKHGPVLHRAELAYAIVRVSIEMPDPAPHSSMIHASTNASCSQPGQSSRSSQSGLDATPTATTEARSGAEPGGHPTADDSSAHNVSSALVQVQRSAALKKEGTDLFKAGDVRRAIARWCAALSEVDLLSQTIPRLAEAANRGRSGRQESLAALTCTALMWAPRTVSLQAARAKHAAALWSALDPQGPPLLPILCAEHGLRMLPEDPELLKLFAGFQKPMQAFCTRIAAGMAGKSAAERSNELEMSGSADDASGFALKDEVQAMMTMRPDLKTGAEKYAGPMPAEFDRDFFRRTGMPCGCDAPRCHAHLASGAKDAFLEWVSLVSPWTTALAAGRKVPHGSIVDGTGVVADPLGGGNNPILTPGTYGKRFQGQDDIDSHAHWWQHAPVGTVAWRLPSTYHDFCEKLQTFSNVQQHAFPLGGGEHVHVGVGFVDLGHVAETLVDTGGRGEQLRLDWTGVEASAHACALTLVIVRMLQAGVPVDSIVQVWYSAAWSRETLECFQGAITALLDSPDARKKGPHAHSSEVLAWLSLWHSAEVPLKQARREWLKRQVKSSGGIANARSSRDRDALSAYCLTGQLLDAESGSVPMFALLQRSGRHVDYTSEEHVLTTIPPRALMQAYKGLAKGERTLMAAALVVLRRRVRALQTALADGTLTVQVVHATVAANDAASVSRIAALRPDSMSWSNAAEYMQPQAFHALARRCSFPHTRHFLHAMNWVKSVKGAFMLDYCEIPRSSAATVKRRCDMAAQAYRESAEFVEKVGAAAVLRRPVMDNSMNVAGAMLARQLHRGWLEAFVSKCEAGVPVSYVVLHEPVYWYFSRAGSVVHFELRYF